MRYRKELDEIKRLYPEKRLAESKERLISLWDFRKPKDRIPFVFDGLPGFKPSFALDLHTEHSLWFNEETTSEERLRIQLEHIIARAIFEDDYIPSLFPGVRTGTIPTSFGAKEEYRDGHFWCRPMIYDKPEDVYKLKKPDFRKDGIAKEMLDRIRFFRKETNSELPIHFCDMQGPLDTAALLWNYEDFLKAMYDSPEEVHFLMNFLTECFIEFVKLQVEAAEGDLIPMHLNEWRWMPIDRGVAMSEDVLVVLSPELYNEFVKPYNERIAEEFGGAAIHFCGSTTKENLKNLLKMKGFIGLNSRVPFDELVKTGFGKKDVILHDAGTEEQIKHVCSVVKKNNLFVDLEICWQESVEKSKRLNQMLLEETQL